MTEAQTDDALALHDKLAALAEQAEEAPKLEHGYSAWVAACIASFKNACWQHRATILAALKPSPVSDEGLVEASRQAMQAAPIQSDEVRGLLERLSNLQDGNAWPSTIDLLNDFADALEDQQRQIEAKDAALKPFADCCAWIGGDEDDEEWTKFRLLIKNYRAARAALEAKKDGRRG